MVRTLICILPVFFSSFVVLTLFIGDYYFLQAGNELLSMNLINCSGSVTSNSSNATTGGDSSPAGSTSTSSSYQRFAYFWTLYSFAFGLSVALIVL